MAISPFDYLASCCELRTYADPGGGTPRHCISSGRYFACYFQGIDATELRSVVNESIHFAIGRFTDWTAAVALTLTPSQLVELSCWVVVRVLLYRNLKRRDANEPGLLPLSSPDELRNASARETCGNFCQLRLSPDYVPRFAALIETCLYRGIAPGPDADGYAAIGRLGRKIGVLTLEIEDFDLIYADGSAVGRFCDQFESLDLTPAERFHFMQLIVASLDRALLDDLPSAAGDEQRVERLLGANVANYRTIVEYWDRAGGDRVFRVSPMMRRLRSGEAPQ